MNKKQYLYSNLFAWSLVLFLIANHIFGWTTPSQDPPGGNVILETGTTPAGSTGYIQFNDAGNLGADSNLFWDNTNKRFGIGTTAPAQKLHVAGNLRVDGAIVAPEGTLRDDAGGWVRTYGATGWYSQTYGGGWYMTDSTYVKSYNNKPIYVGAGNSYFGGNVGIGTVSPGAKLDIVAPASSGAGNELRICKNGTCCPIWKDCDGDGYTYGYGDCDESCATCYVDSPHYLAQPDGKDQDCNGTVDDLSPAGTYVATCDGRSVFTVEAACPARCAALYDWFSGSYVATKGWVTWTSSATCDGYTWRHSTTRDPDDQQYYFVKCECLKPASYR